QGRRLVAASLLRRSCTYRPVSPMIAFSDPGPGNPGLGEVLPSMAQHRAMVYASTVPAAGEKRPGADIRAEFTGCPWHDVRTMLRRVGLRPTRQRMSLGWILFAKGDRAGTARVLSEEGSTGKG